MIVGPRRKSPRTVVGYQFLYLVPTNMALLDATPCRHLRTFDGECMSL
jgi:hypothetical protein